MRPFLRKRLLAFFYAFRGSIYWLSEFHCKIHFLAAMLAIVISLLFKLTALEWCLMSICITCVWVAEAVNTALEKLADVCHEGIHPLIQQSKDVSAFAVLLTAINALVVAGLIWIPKI